MFSTTLRIDDALGNFLAEMAKSQTLSVNAFLAGLIERERAETHRRRLAQDWAALAREGQDVEYALSVQADLVAERPKAYTVRKPGSSVKRAPAKKAGLKPARTRTKVGKP
jgi:hypothetical protein